MLRNVGAVVVACSFGFVLFYIKDKKRDGGGRGTEKKEEREDTSITDTSI